MAVRDAGEALLLEVISIQVVPRCARLPIRAFLDERGVGPRARSGGGWLGPDCQQRPAVAGELPPPGRVLDDVAVLDHVRLAQAPLEELSRAQEEDRVRGAG